MAQKKTRTRKTTTRIAKPRTRRSPAARGKARAALTADALKRDILENLHYRQARIPATATRNDWYRAVAFTVRDRLIDNWVRSLQRLGVRESKIVGYLSAEYLTGPHLANNIASLGIEEQLRSATRELDVDLEDLIEIEEEPGLGNGGLGRLAACYMDSLATLGVPAVGYGIRYEFGIFDQEIRDGWQVEKTDKWLHLGNPWEIARPELAYYVKLGGRTEAYRDEEGHYAVRWTPTRVVKGIAYDTPIQGYRNASVALLRLWGAEAVESFDFQAFNVGDYYKAVDEKIVSETVSKILYPNDEREAGRRLRLVQQYFFVSCSLQDMIRIHLLRGESLETLHDGFAIQLNDTHPALAVAELMRLLVDEHRLGWEDAWRVTQATISYTNHTLLPEALERWRVSLLSSTLPRHLEIIYEINQRFLEEVRARFPGDEELVQRISLVGETGERHVRMAHLAAVGSHAINGVAALHSELLRKTVLRDFHRLHPERFTNVTNGVTPRRWLAYCNPGLARLVTERIGDRWVSDLERQLRRLEPLAEDAGFRAAWRAVKLDNKARLAAVIKARTGIVVDPRSLFDIQVKRIHEYKRQHLNVLHIITLFNRLKANPALDLTPRTFVFGGKAAPGYPMAKLIIKLIHSVADVVNGDPDVAGRLKVVFLPDFNVKRAQRIYPSADLSEQISTAGKEASGTGNMKFTMNGALTIGTLDGANVELRDAVGADNFFLFGLTVDEIARRKAEGYDPWRQYESNHELREAVDQIASGFFSHGDKELFGRLVSALLNHDDYMLLADYPTYVDCQEQVGAAYRDQERWAEMSILNVARVGRFSSDRSIREYCDRIWHVSVP